MGKDTLIGRTLAGVEPAINTPYVTPLTPEMQRCITLVEKYGRIVRYVSGKWQRENAPLKRPGYKNEMEFSAKYCLAKGIPYNGVGMNTVKRLIELQLLTPTRWGIPPDKAFYPVECVRSGRSIQSTKFSII